MELSFPRPVLVVSRCLEFAPCRWNGLSIASETVARLKPYVNFIPVCPEVEIGLGTPREPIRLIKDSGDIRLFQSATGRDLTGVMRDFSETFLRSLPDVDGCILKDRSPSCGDKDVKIYPGPGKVAALQEKGSGLFAEAILGNRPDWVLENEGRLNNFTIREYFYTRLFTLAAFRKMSRQPQMKNLVAFHAENKLLLMAYNQTLMRALGRITANHDQLSPETVFREYRNLLGRVLGKPARTGAHINVLMHALGYFSKRLTPGERSHFLALLENLRNKTIPLSACLTVMTSWITRFEEPYLAGQRYFSPYPPALIEISDSGKGRNR